jgi:hypothetical protein
MLSPSRRFLKYSFILRKHKFQQIIFFLQKKIYMNEPDLNLVVEKLIKEELQTKEYYFGEETIYREWREQLHDEIISEILSGIYTDKHTVYMLGGAPANGKSTFLKSSQCAYPSGR